MKFPILSLVDYAVAAASVIYGAYVGSPWWVAAGLIAGVCACFDVGERVTRYLKARFIRGPAAATAAAKAATGYPPPPSEPHPRSDR